MHKIFISLFFSGILFGSGLCLSSCGPILISYVSGSQKSAAAGMLAYAVFSLSRISVYLALSIFIFFAGRFAVENTVNEWHRHIAFLGGIFIIFIGILVAAGKHFEFTRINWLQKKLIQHDKKSLIMLGVIMGLAPCSPLLAVLSYIGLISKTWVESLAYALTFGAGTFLSPLLLLVALSGSINRFLIQKEDIYRRVFNAACGTIIIVFGIHLLVKRF